MRLFQISFILLFGLACTTALSITPNNASKTSCDFGSYEYTDQCYDCGLTSFQPNDRIVGGMNAVKGSWPAQVLVVQGVYIPQLGSHYRFQCGGTLIRRNVVLTAAHCINTEIEIRGVVYPITTNSMYPTFESMFTVYVGAYNIAFVASGQSPDSSVVVSGASKVIQHESYSENMYRNDIALIILKQSVTPNSYINVACLPVKSNSFPSSSNIVYAAGWGTLYENGPSPTILQDVKLTVYDPMYCKNVLPALQKDWNAQICAGKYEGGQDTCQGDSGGGLMIPQQINGVKKYVVSGIVSYGYGCAKPNYPGIYTRTSHYIDWIESHIGSGNIIDGSGSGVLKSYALVYLTTFMLLSINIITNMI